MGPKTRRAKRPVAPALATRDDMERCVGEIAEMMIERDALTAEMDARLKAIRDEYQARLAELEEDVQFELAKAAEWAEANRGAFGERKSIEMVHGTVGYRTGTPALKTLRGWTWALVLERLGEMRLARYIRTKCEPDKEKLLADREALGGRLTEMGVHVVQTETFYVEPKRETNAEVTA